MLKLLRSTFIHFCYWCFLVGTLFLGAVLKTHGQTSPAWYIHPEESTNSNAQPPASELLLHSVFLVGDAGELSTNPLEPAIYLLKQQLQVAEASNTLLFLGDNIYPAGLPSAESDDRALAEARLRAQAEVLKVAASGYFIPGNHDWDRSGKQGWEMLGNQETFLGEYLGDSTVFQPSGGCPGPEEIALSEELTLLIIDTQWWLHLHDKPAEDSQCEAKTKSDFLLLFADAIARNMHKKVIVAAHHPLVSNGLHGGHAPPKSHLFPLTNLKKQLYVPLPVIGSVYVFYRTLLGARQDIPHPTYKALKNAVEAIISQHPDLVWASGHDHSMQYLQAGGVHHVISGSGSKASFVAHNPKARFAFAEKGFARLDYYTNGEVWLAFWVPQDGGTAGKMVYSRQISAKPFLTSEIADYQDVDFSGQQFLAAATDQLTANETKRLLLGSNYRAEWEQKIANIPVFDLGTAKGGLSIIKKGGGMQTKSLRMEDAEGRQYVLRSVEKYPEKAVPLALRGTIAQEIVEDQISGSHPYAALSIPLLADAAGVYHANPELVYLPDDPRLGIYRQDFANGLFLFEERLSGKHWKEADHFGNPKKMIGTDDLLEKITKDNDDLVDQQQVLRSRLFDMWIGDWDRHDDQWRWAEKKDKKNDIKYYQPIPRDRDQAFFEANGFLMSVSTRKWGLRKLQGFKHHLRDPEGLAFNARYFDRSFLTVPDLADWMATAEDLKAKLTDEVIEKAINQMPPEIAQLSGEEIIEKLKARRNALSTYATDFYRFLAREVNVVGTDKHEFFKVERLNKDETRVQVFKRKKDGEIKHLIYDRVFLRQDTEEIRLYGLKGEDVFQVEGDVKKGILVRIIGGEGEDSFIDRSRVKGLGRYTHIYDTHRGNLADLGRESRNRTSRRPEVNAYNRKDFKYDLAAPLAFLQFNPDDGLFVGGGLSVIQHGFRKDPFKARHVFKGNFAPRTTSFNLIYQGEFIHLLGRTDLLLEADLKVPSFVDFFFGLGNETSNLRDEFGNNYYRVRYTQALLKPELRRSWQDGRHQIRFSPGLQYIEIEDELEGGAGRRFILDNYSGQDSLRLLENYKLFGELGLSYQLDTRNNHYFPTKGTLLSVGAKKVNSLDFQAREIDYWHYHANWSFYLSTPGPQLRTTWAARVGGALNNGIYEEVFQANTLGGFHNLRGHRRMRFAGDRSFYVNNDLRIKLADVRTYVFPASIGIMGFYDLGRVWVNNDPSTATGNSDKWHRGYGAGVWMTPFAAATISAEVSISEDENRPLPFVRFGFMF